MGLQTNGPACDKRPMTDKLSDAAKKLEQKADRLKFEADSARAARLPEVKEAMKRKGITPPEDSSE